jgi:type VI secretion system secreted protein VgrG
MHGREALGEPFCYALDLVSADPNIELTDLLGEALSVQLELPGGGLRYFHGIVTSLEFVDTDGESAHYRATVRPWLWLLTQTTDCRIFQNKSIPDIVKEVFQAHDFGDFEVNLVGDYAAKDYVVQYRESDFNFVSRLLEEAGIYYYFRHDESTHTLTLVDSYSAHEAVSGYETLPYYAPDPHRAAVEEFVDHWRLTQAITPGSATLRDFDFERPKASLEVALSSAGEYRYADFPLYDYPGDYRARPDGETQVRVRLEQRQLPFESADAHTNARGLTTGALFSLTDQPRDDQNREYLIVSTQLSVRGHEIQSGAEGTSPVFSCDFVAIRSRVPFRTAPIARKPVVDGPQTATVVGPSGEEIWTDKYGRVKLQFHWDREGKSDENSSCWVRVSQAWAGGGWGAIHIPRIGQEVIVDFLEGDPDRPIVVGRVYNASNMPPYGLPDHQTQSGIKSRSTKGGAAPNANEIRFEDSKGHEELYIQAERTQTTLVKGSQSISVGGDRSVGVTGNETYTVKKKRTTEITEDESLKVTDGDVTHLFQHNQTVNVGDTYSAQVKNDYSVETDSGQILLTHGNSEFNITQSQDLWADTENAHVKLEPGGDIDIANQNAQAYLASGGAILIKAAAADITIKRDSTTIVVTSDKISITADAKVLASVGGSTIELTSSEGSITVGGSKVDLTASGVTVTGTMVKLNS